MRRRLALVTTLLAFAGTIPAAAATARSYDVRGGGFGHGVA